jgi:DNA gyrase subunit B
MENQSNQKNNSYTAKDIYVLKGLEPVRRRPGMYIGSTGADGLHHLIWEVVDNSLDEAMVGYCSHIEVILQKNNRVVVSDNGRGIPVEIHPDTGKSTLETVMTTLHAGGKFGGEAYKISGGLHGVGVSVVCALSKYMRAEVCRDGFKWAQEYSKGNVISKVKKIEPSNRTGTTIIFEPDEEIFSQTTFDLKRILNHLRQQAYLTEKIKITVRDERQDLPFVYNFYFEGGLKSYIRYLVGETPPRHTNIFYCKGEKDNVVVEAALQYLKDFECLEESFANNIYTGEGGTHLTGLRGALTRTINDYARKNGFLKEKDENLLGSDVREGLVAAVSVKLREPQFEGQTKAKLGNPEAKTAVEDVVGTMFADFLEKNPQDAASIINTCLLSAKARLAAKAARTTVLRKGVLDGLSLPGKLADCISKKAEESELYIVEGDSAGGSSKMARDRRFQAILPLRGKILNVEKARLEKLLSSEEIKNLIIALGTAIAQDFDINNLRYHRIIIMSDADIDGAHIRTLLLTLFFRHFKEVIERGYLYIAQPPLYKIQSGKRTEYAYSDAEKEDILQEILKEKNKTADGKKLKKQEPENQVIITEDQEQTSEQTIAAQEKKSGIFVQRYKGLGEMNPQELWETTMNPQNRVLLKVTIEDAKEADRMFDVLMGQEVAPRKKFIQTHAKNVKNLDI